MSAKTGQKVRVQLRRADGSADGPQWFGTVEEVDDSIKCYSVRPSPGSPVDPALLMSCGAVLVVLVIHDEIEWISHLEVSDFTVVSCDGKRALADFSVWDSVSSRFIELRVSYTLGDSALTPEGGSHYYLLALLLQDAQAIADMREAVLAQRDFNQEKN